MKKILLVCVGVCLFASESASSYDIVPRAINFIIFIGIIYYLGANFVKHLYSSRISTIQNRLESIQNELEKTNAKKDEVMRLVNIAQEEANTLIQDAKEQALILHEQIIANVNKDIEILKNRYNEQKEFLTKSAKEEVINEIIENILNKEINLKQDEILDIITKKVV